MGGSRGQRGRREAQLDAHAFALSRARACLPRHTYSRAMCEQLIAASGQDPISCQPLSSAGVFPNRLVAEMQLAFEAQAAAL